MGLWTRIRTRTRGPNRALREELSSAYLDELRMARQFRLHAERVPYPNLGAAMRGLGDQEEAHAALLHAELARLGSAPGASDGSSPPTGRNHWERLTVDFADLRAKIKRYIELAQHWDIEHPDTAALFGRVAREETTMCRVLGEMIARSDPHAQD